MDFKGKKVLITGADGFIGSHLTEKLVECGANVTALAQYNSFNSWGWLDSINSGIKNEINIITGDVRENDSVRNMIRGQEVVMHLAALIAIPYSYISPMAYIRTNIEGTTNILEACRDSDTIQKIIHTSTSETYGTAMYVPIDEKHPVQGQSPYSASKIAADKIAESFYRSFSMPICTVRPFNTYGPRQSARAVIPTIITQLLAGKTDIKLGSLTPTRDFNYVKDTVNGFIEIAKSDKVIGEEINIATQSEISIGDLVEKLIRQINPDARIVCDSNRLRPDKSEVNRLLGCNEKIKKLTKWKPQYTLDNGLNETISWIKKNLERYKVDIYNV